MTAVDPDRVLAGLQQLAELTSDDRGAQRVAFTAGWERARAFLRERLDELAVEVTVDAAHNLWALLPGETEPPLALGSHLDSVPGGGRLDGALGVLAALEVLRAAGPRPPRSLALVDWADEEGRFGHSLLGSAAATGTADLDALRAAGAGDVLDLDALAATTLPELHAYLELHIEQGPVLERAGAALAAVSGTFGVRRAEVTFAGEAAHAGATPLDARHDPVRAAARFVLAADTAAREADGLVTVGSLEAMPGTPTAVAASCRLTFDARHAEAAALEQLHAQLVRAAGEAADAEGCTARQRVLWVIDPIAFSLADAAAAVVADHPPMPSGPLHDAASVARAGVPTAMLFVRSLGGVSHSPAEASSDDDVRAGVHALARLADHILKTP